MSRVGRENSTASISKGSVKSQRSGDGKGRPGSKLSVMSMSKRDMGSLLTLDELEDDFANPAIPAPRPPLKDIKFGMPFLHTSDPETWNKLCIAMEDFVDLCEEWKLSNPADLANAIQRIRSVTGQATEGMIAFKRAVAMLKERGVCEVVAFCGPSIVALTRLVMQLPLLFPQESYPEGLPLLLKGTTNQVFLSRRQIGALLAATLFAALPTAEARKHRKMQEPLDFEFGGVYDLEVQKSLCLVCYLSRIATASEEFLDQVVSFGRRFEAPVLHDYWMQVDKPLFKAHVQEGPLDVSHMSLQANFTNETIGGGVLEGCYGQEEIRFTICPELLVARLFCDGMGTNEAVFIAGVRQYSCYSGKDREFTFEGPFLEEPWGMPDKENRCGAHIAIMDPLLFPGKAQYEPGNVVRECLKSYVACLGDPSEEAGERRESFASGNWGCGMWGGDPQLKFLMQWLVASANQRELVYHPFGDERMEELQDIIDKVWDSGARVGDLYKLLHGHRKKRGVFAGVQKNIDALLSAGILVSRPREEGEDDEEEQQGSQEE